MPLLSIEHIKPKVMLGIWQIEAKPSDLLDSYSQLTSVVPSEIKSQGRVLERLAVAALVSEMTGIDCPHLSHQENGAPLLAGYHIGISHTRGYAVVILSQDYDVAVDIEYKSNRVERIVSKFVRNDEQADSLDRLLLNWCAKETVYKLLNAENLQYFDMRVKPYEIKKEGSFQVENLKRPHLVNVSYRIKADYTLTFSCLS